jgi:tetratricopeptide (TPR) repeat protein
MAGNAALAGGDTQAALAVLDVAHADAEAANDKPLAGDIAIDRARALVALGRDGDAATALAEARAALPANPQAWLLSATLSRRMGKLAEAQAEIEKAAELLPIDPDIGLEAGVIAVLSGREEAARKSWQSVIDAAPKSDAAATARGYLAQLGEGGTAKP